MSSIGKYGPAAIGEEQYEKEQAELARNPRGTTRYGPAIMEDWDQHLEEGQSIHSGRPSGVEAGQVEREKREEPYREPPDELPPGYELDGGNGGWFRLVGPDGEVIEGPTQSGKFQKPDALRAAAHHYENQVKQADADDGASAEDQLSLNELRGALEHDPDLVDSLMQKEFMRAEGPRPEALRAMRATEESRDEPRQEVLDSLEALIADVGEG